MTSIADSSVIIQTSSESVPSPPCWLGEVVLIVHHLRKLGVLDAITSQVRFARRHFGHYEVIDFLAVLFGYAISGERTLEEFYERLAPWAEPFMALFGRQSLPARSTLSRFLSALTPAPVEALRSLFLADLLARPLGNEREIGGLVDRTGKERVVFDIDGTREAVRQRALPQTSDRPTAQRRMTQVCAPGYTGRKRGEAVRTRTAVSQSHSYQWLGSFGNPGNGQYREELRLAVGAIQRYLSAHQLPQERALLRLDGQYGTGAVLLDLAGFSFVVRGKDYAVLDRPEVQARLHLPADQSFTRPESALERMLYDCPDVPVGPNGARCRVVVATHPANAQKRRVGHTRQGIVYELFFTDLPQEAFMASDVVALYLHRGAFEPVLADEDQELDPDRWCSHSPAGQQAWQIVSQWIWNVRLELGHQLEPTELRTTEFAPAVPEAKEQQPASSGYGKPSVAAPWKAGRFSGQDFVLQSDGTLRCPANQSLVVHERRREADGSLRVVYAASIRSCRPCPLREQCQWQGSATAKPRQVSVLLHPLVLASAPLLWRDWSRRLHRRVCIQLLRHQRVEVQMDQACSARPDVSPSPLSRAQRAHYRLSWPERLARNARAPTEGPVRIKLFGVPEALTTFLGLPTS
jgi:hypothetical protein